MHSNAEKRFIRVNLITIIALFLVIAAGGIVRSTGSGMGCPDWPTCFNRVIPPTHASQLPPGYEQEYIDGRVKKNIRFANIIEKLGFPKKADQIRHDESIKQHEEFNAAKTWTEYFNRLVGVMSGFFLILSALFALTYVKTKVSVFVLSVVNLLLVMFQGWLGSIVVSTNLTPWVITVHMLLALIIVGISIYTYFKATTLRDSRILVNHTFKGVKPLAVLSLLIFLVQVVFGTEVREVIDALNYAGERRADWIDLSGEIFTMHRFFGYFSFALIIVLFLLVKNRFNPHSKQSIFAWIVLGLAGLQMLSGIFLARYDVPAFLQTTHLILASLLFGAHYYLMLLMNKLKRINLF